MFIFPIFEADDDEGAPRHLHRNFTRTFLLRGADDARDIGLRDGCGTAVASFQSTYRTGADQVSDIVWKNVIFERKRSDCSIVCWREIFALF